ncbi:hypothetical protein C8Q80DRAFT_836655 [Daedaleopsis nitida]|nr:hypothetical protein C8Q80DRAFT_836655 [Daedaleopsis nitida]
MVTLRKYAQAYHKHFPLSTQIIVAADPLRYWKCQSARERVVLPAVRKLEELNLLSPNPESGRPPQILIHALSNGGAMSLADLAIALAHRDVKVPEGAKCAMIFDSTPAPVTLSLAVRAFTVGFRSLFQKLLFGFGLSVVYFLTFIVRTIMRQPEPIAIVLKQLNDLRLLPWTSVRTPRMYFYSSGDRIVPAKDVEEHAAMARMLGFPVQMLNFGKSDHVSHARDYPEKYWEAVRAFWRDVGSNQLGHTLHLG